MSTQDDLIYDDVESMKFIKNYLPQELKEKFSDDDIYYIVDLIYDFYDSKGFMDESDDDDSVVEINEEELIDYVIKTPRKMASASSFLKKSNSLSKENWNIAIH